MTAISGTTITITDSRNSTTYTVGASNATVTKNGAASSVAGIAIGDTISVQGTVSGDFVAATNIRDGFTAPETIPWQARIKHAAVHRERNASFFRHPS